MHSLLLNVVTFAGTPLFGARLKGFLTNPTAMLYSDKIEFTLFRFSYLLRTIRHFSSRNDSSNTYLILDWHVEGVARVPKPLF